jgi:RNA polymerase subunit RPABC4/transcription elongation factor Spt4
VLVLCRQCIRYVYEGTTVCPHCGGDSREISDRYREGGYLAIETIQRIARAAEWRRG